MLTWIRNLLGIRKDVIDTNKAKIETLKAELEVDRLEDEASARNLITRVTLDDIKRYDPKISQIETSIKEGYQGEKVRYYHTAGCYGATVVITLLTLVLIMSAKVLGKLLHYLFGW